MKLQKLSYNHIGLIITFFILVNVLILSAGCIQPPKVYEEKRVEEEKLPDLTGKRIILVIAHENFKDKELFDTKDIIESANGTVRIASSKLERATGIDGVKIRPDLLLTDINITMVDALVFIGGPGATEYFNNETAHKLINESIAQNKVVAAICIAPCILAYAGALEGKRATVWVDSYEYVNILQSHGAYYTGDTVTVDNNIITANGPEASEEFGKAIVEALA